MSSSRTITAWLLAIFASLLAQHALGADSGSNSNSPYVELAPSFVTNYDGGGRLRYLKVDVTVRVQETGGEAVRHHMPYLRNQLVELFSSQLEENLTSTDGKEALRAKALEVIRGAIDHLDGSGSENVVDLYFTSFVIQQ